MVSLDGVMQAPGGLEDASSDFKYGGWTAPYYGNKDDMEVMKQEMQQADYLLGRKTFEIWEAYWPHHADFWPGINKGTKYILSNTRNSTDWKNTTFIDSLEDIKKLKNTEGADIQVWGSSKLVKLLLENDMVDELSLKIYPITLGKGKRIFDDNTPAAAFTLVSNHITSAGVIIANYQRAGAVKTGTIEV